MAYAPVWVPAAIALTGIGHQERVRQEDQKKQRTIRNDAQRQAVDAKVAQKRDALVADRRSKQQKPDLAAILGEAFSQGAGGIGSTMLTGPSGVPNAGGLGANRGLG